MYGHQTKMLREITSILKLELGIIMNHFFAKFEEPMFRHSKLL